MRLGIEIRDTQILATLIRRGAAHWEFLNSFKHLRSDGLIALKKQLPRQRIKTIVGLPRKHIQLKEIPVDRQLRAEEIEFYVQKNIPKLFPTLSKEFYFDFETLSEPQKPKQIRLVVAEKVWLDAFLNPFKEARFHLIAADIDELAKNRGLLNCQQLPDPELITALGLALWEPSNEH